MATYIAQHMIRADGKFFKKDEEVKGLSPDSIAGLVKHGALKRIGADDSKSAEEAVAKEAAEKAAAEKEAQKAAKKAATLKAAEEAKEKLANAKPKAPDAKVPEAAGGTADTPKAPE